MLIKHTYSASLRQVASENHLQQNHDVGFDALQRQLEEEDLKSQILERQLENKRKRQELEELDSRKK